MKRSHDRRNSSAHHADEEGPNQSASLTKTAGIVHKISLENFLCHDKLEIEFNPRINFIIGKNGSGKSAVLTGIVVALGERATTTQRGTSMKDFIKTGRSRAVVKVTLLNQGRNCYQPDVYGNFITIERTINVTGSGGYKLLNERDKCVSTKRADLNRILAKMNLQVDNPVCILNQETAKNFLHSSDATQKYKLFERATQMDVMSSDFCVANEELNRSKSCIKEKIQSLELLKSEVTQWHAKKKWYDSINEIHDKKAQLENMICWAQVEDYEKKAESAKELEENQATEIKKVQQKIDICEEKLRNLENKKIADYESSKEKASQIKAEQEKIREFEKKIEILKNRQTEIQSQVRQHDIERRRVIKDQQDLNSGIENLRKLNGDTESVRRREMQMQELENLKGNQDRLLSLKKVSEHQVEQLRGAVSQLRNEAGAARSEASRLQQLMESKLKELDGLKQSDANAYSVYGDWVVPLLNKIKQTNFRGTTPKGPIGAYIKLKDPSWAPVIEASLGQRLLNFVCSNDEDAKTLNHLIEQVIPQRGHRPSVVTSAMNGEIYNVSNNKVVIHPELESKGIHCMLDILIIDDNDIANILIDMNGVEQLMIMQKDQDAQYYLSESSRVPLNCHHAITKQGNTYYPDPNYRTYAGKVYRTRWLQASVEDAIRDLNEEIANLHPDVTRARDNIRRLNEQVQANERELRLEQTKLTSTTSDLNAVVAKIRTFASLEEPEQQTDVLALEEDLLAVQQNLERIESEKQFKEEALQALKKEVSEVTQQRTEIQRIINSLISEFEPMQDTVKQNEHRLKEYQESIEKLSGSLLSMQGKLKNFVSDYEAANKRAADEKENAERLCSRVTVTKSLKTLHSELKRIREQVATQEKEFGSKDFVLSEFRRRKIEYDRAEKEVGNSQKSLKKMMQMSKQRKAFIVKFRDSIMMRTHHVFQALLKTRNFEGEIRFDTNEKTLILMVTPPGRDEPLHQTPKRSRMSGNADIRSLSGGERSFATVCFVLSLWDAIESPFRILDEFDVFMDHVNRSISMDLLITEARENAGRQFIFLTPLGLEKEQDRDDLSILRLNDPDRRAEGEPQND